MYSCSCIGNTSDLTVDIHYVLISHFLRYIPFLIPEFFKFIDGLEITNREGLHWNIKFQSKI